VLADVAVDTAPAGFLNGFVADHCPLGHDGKFLDERTAPALEAAGFTLADDRLIEVPWTFGSREEAGDFGRNLFGMTGLSAAAVADALEQEIGLSAKDGWTQLDWVLRRIVADAG
jgi:hypothetical protein